jgi:transposase InsO family protein
LGFKAAPQSSHLLKSVYQFSIAACISLQPLLTASCMTNWPMADGRSIHLFNVIDDYSREGLIIDVDVSLPTERVARSLDQLIEGRGKPCVIRCDTGRIHQRDREKLG